MKTQIGALLLLAVLNSTSSFAQSTVILCQGSSRSQMSSLSADEGPFSYVFQLDQSRSTVLAEDTQGSDEQGKVIPAKFTSTSISYDHTVSKKTVQTRFRATINRAAGTITHTTELQIGSGPPIASNTRNGKCEPARSNRF